MLYLVWDLDPIEIHRKNIPDLLLLDTLPNQDYSYQVTY